MGKLFGLNFVFRPVFLSVLPAIAGFFVMFSLLQKCGLGKVLSVNYLLCLFELKFLRKMGVDRGRDRTAQTVPRPDAHDFAWNAALAASADERVSEFVWVSLGQKPLHARRDRVEVGDSRLLKINERQQLPRHRGDGDLAENDVLSQPLFAGLTLQPLAFDGLNAFEFRLPQS